MNRLAVIALLASLLMASASFELFHVSAEQERENLIEWQRMDEGARDDMRRTWRELSSLKGGLRETSQRRLATVARLLERRRARTGHKVTHDELLTLLGDYPERLAGVLDRHGLPPGLLHERMQNRTRRLVLSFLNGLTETGRLDEGQSQDIEGLPYPELISEALTLQKREEIYLYAEGAPPLEQVDVLGLQELSPLDVAEKMREARRRRGLLGRASRDFDLSAADRSWLAGVSDEKLVSGLRTLFEPKVRAHLEAKDWSEADISRVLSEPFRKLERTLNRIERQGR